MLNCEKNKTQCSITTSVSKLVKRRVSVRHVRHLRKKKFCDSIWSQPGIRSVDLKSNLKFQIRLGFLAVIHTDCVFIRIKEGTFYRKFFFTLSVFLVGILYQPLRFSVSNIDAILDLKQSSRVSPEHF